MTGSIQWEFEPGKWAYAIGGGAVIVGEETSKNGITRLYQNIIATFDPLYHTFLHFSKNTDKMILNDKYSTFNCSLLQNESNFGVFWFELERFNRPADFLYNLMFRNVEILTVHELTSVYQPVHYQ